MANAVLQAVLQFSERMIARGEDIHPYHVFYGYARILSMDESTIQVMFNDPKSPDDIEAARRFFNEHQLDANLLKTGLATLIPYLPSDDKARSSCQGYVDKLLEEESGFSTYDMFKSIISDDDPLFKVFVNGNDMGDVFDYQQTLKEKKSEETGEEKSDGSQEEDKGIEGKTPDHKTPDHKTADQKDGTSSAKGSRENDRMTFQDFSETYRKLRIDLLDVVKGQNDPVLEFVQGCFQGEILTDPGNRKRPKAVFLFVGPAGVGKTLLAQTAAESLGYPSMLFNMSEYSTPQAHEGLIGVAPFYKDAEEGRLVKFVRENPKCILIFDEIEKASRNTIQLFLQILDLGVVDNVFKKKKTEFKDAIIIFTSNACSSIYDSNIANVSRTPKNVILDALKHETNPSTGQVMFPEAICSRIAAGNVIMFNHLSIRDLSHMASDMFNLTAQQIEKDYGYQVSFDRRLPLLFLFNQGGNMDARIASRQSSKFLKKELFELVRQMESHPGLLDNVSSLRFEIDLDHKDVSEEIKTLFMNPNKTEIVIVCDKENRSSFDALSDCHVHFAESVEDLNKCMELDVAFVLVDLMYGLTEEGIRGVSLDDYSSIGVKAFQRAIENEYGLPVFILEVKEQLKETDKNIFFQKGASGVVSLVTSSEASVCRQIEQIAEEIYIEKQGKNFVRKGYVLEFNTAQIICDTSVIIQYHDLKKQQAYDSESASYFVADVERPTEKFEDVIGAENAKEELKYFIKYLSNPRVFVRDGGKPAKGLLLYGPPGTGKTMLARAMAGESDVAFIHINATDFLSKWVGQSEQNVRDLFTRAKRYAPAIIFIDEIDAIGKSRTGADPITEKVLNTLLTEIDGFKVDIRHPVFVLAATNYRVEGSDQGRMALDQALVRRFDNRILVDLPNEKERLQYLKLITSKKNFGDVDEATIKNLATRTPGLSIAILQNVVDLALRNARKKDKLPGGKELQEALEEYNYGERRTWGESYYKSVAIHESGHAYIAYLSGEKPSYLTIESRGDFGGYMAHENSEDRPNYTKEDLIWRIRCSLAGRAAEIVFFGSKAAMNTGASSDLQHATNIALRMVCELGMMETQLVALPFNTIINSPMAAAYVEQANEVLQEEMATTIQLLRDGKEQVEKLAEKLVENNHLTGEEILEILG